MAELPADVQAAVGAYCTARSDDATWRRYVDDLEPGIALDVAAYLCGHMIADHTVVEDLQVWYTVDPDDDERGYVPVGVPRLSRSLETFVSDVGFEIDDIRLHRPRFPASPEWRVSVGCSTADEDWEEAGVVTCEEWERWYATLAPGTWDMYAVAACRAICYSWSPTWARQAARTPPGGVRSDRES